MSKISMKIATSVAVIGGIAAGALSASAALNLPTMSCSYMFNTNMKVGSRGVDVMNLQKVLNMYPQTQVAFAPNAGSPGYETTTFGPSTRRAANAFQSLHLAELGISAPTGNVFAGTRGLLNQVCNGSVSTNPTTPTTPGTVVTGPVSVMLSSTQPAGGVITGQAGALLANLTFTGNGTVSSVTLHRGGVSDQSTLTNVYLYDGATRLTDGYSFNNNGTLTMNNVNLMVNGSRTVSVRGDVASGATPGQTISAILAGFSTSAGANATNISGNMMSIISGSGILTTVALNTASPSPAAATVNAGVVNQNLWSNTLSVGVHAAKLQAMTVKMIGSAPSNTLANVGLFVDGSKVGMATLNGNSQFVFDLSSAPYSLTTGSHVIEIRGDVIGGAYRNFYLSLEKSADLMVLDSQVSGGTVAVTPTYSLQPVTNMLGGLVTISNGTLTINQDTSFSNITTLVGGATNVKMAAFKFTAYGEDVKVNSLSFTPTLSGLTGTQTLINVGLYINGGQVGSNQTVTNPTAITFNSLGSNLVVPVGTPVTVELRGDVINAASVNHTAGSVQFALAAGSSNAQGVGSGQLTSTGAASGQSLTVSSASVTFGQASGWAGATVSPNKEDVKIGSFTVQTGSAESVTINNILVGITGSMIASSSISKIVVKSGSEVIGTPVGNPTASNNFSASAVVPMSSSKTFDVYANILSAVNAATVIPAMTVTYRGNVSNVTTTSSAVTGSTITANVSTIGASGVTFVPSSSAVAQFLVGGQTAFAIGTFNVKTSNAVAGAIIKDVTVTVPANTIGKVTMGSASADVVSGATTTTVYGVNITVPGDASGVNIPMTVSLNCIGTNCAGSSTALVSLAITTLTYNDGSATQTVSPTTATTSVSSLVASKPTVSMSASSGSGFTNGNQQIGTVTVSADAAGDIKLVALPITISISGAATIVANTVELRDASGNTVIVGSSTAGVNGSAALSGSGTFSFNTSARTITKGTSETYTVWANFTGVAGAANTMSETFGLGAKASFLWNDVIGGASNVTGAYLNTYPSTTQTKNN